MEYSDNELMLIKSIMNSLNENEKSRLLELFENHNKAVKEFRGGDITTIPTVEIKFIQTGHLVLGA